MPLPSLLKTPGSSLSYGSSDGLESNRDVTTAETTPRALTPLLATKSQDIHQLLETYTGVAAAVVLDDAVIRDLGLDSLALTKLASELQPVDGCPIYSEQLVLMTVRQLEERFHGA
ncbi:hypothetical protein K469DRAFT_694872 [Zopfia rhizophila CBS 207.26]|uniref:Carrier domain-containing protein n=1 Tax=Zopfia rhizophila CBS 207.26 TaxID=1314779 RepID=A0A6A6DJ28_9PEZI|nr:hypothetical protein K469DRAFT_694872 [Zopfia rhizophila CBS 207.26]